MHFAKNINYLRRLNALTQEELAQKTSLNRKRISAYEQGVVPKVDVILTFAQYFGISVDDLLSKDLASDAKENIKLKEKEKEHTAGKDLRVLSITISEDDDENVEMVPVKAAAGYTEGYADPEFLKDLPRFKLPFLSNGRTYRAFEIKGDSMLPMVSGSIVIAESVLDWSSVTDGSICVVVSSNDGVVLKKVYDYSDERGTLVLKSNNPAYPHYEIEIDEVKEIWKYVAHISKEFPEHTDETDLQAVVEQLKDEIFELQHSKK